MNATLPIQGIFIVTLAVLVGMTEAGYLRLALYLGLLISRKVVVDLLARREVDDW